MYCCMIVNLALVCFCKIEWIFFSRATPVYIVNKLKIDIMQEKVKKRDINNTRIELL